MSTVGGHGSEEVTTNAKEARRSLLPTADVLIKLRMLKDWQISV
jgi:hypothetical protein